MEKAYRNNEIEEVTLKTMKPIMTDREIEVVMASEYCDVLVEVEESPFFMDSIYDLEIEMDSGIDRWDDDLAEAEIIDFASFIVADIEDLAA